MLKNDFGVNLPYHIDVHLLLDTGSLISGATVVEHCLRFVSSVHNDSFCVIRVLEVKENTIQ